MASPSAAGVPETVIRPVILCGGSGTRLWPVSTPARPKQHRALISDASMIAQTAARTAGSSLEDLSFEAPLAVGAAAMEAALAADLPEAALLLEPAGRNSAPAIAAAALLCPEEALLLILPADHHIGDIEAFHRALLAGAAPARAGDLVTFGVKPDQPATGYGYIEAGDLCEGARGDPAFAPRKAVRFVEKPDRQTAQGYLETKRFFWNAGVFLFQAGAMRAALKRHAPDILDATALALPDAAPVAGRPARLDPQAFAAVRSQSIDYAVMEPAAKEGRVSVAPVDMDWSDIGDHAALYAVRARGLQPDANVCEGPVVAEESTGCFIRSDGPPVLVRGARDLIVAASPHGVLVAPRGEAANIRSGVERLNRLGPAAGLPAQACHAAARWLTRALSVWAARAWDARRGGFVEQLDLDGRPDAEAVRRVRVQARQIYTFSAALGLGLLPEETARPLILNGLDYVHARTKSPAGGFHHRLTPGGEPADTRRDFYDAAFMALAGVQAWKASGEPAGLELMREAFGFIEEALSDAAGLGWIEGREADGSVVSGPRRANPHMHLLEASLAAHRLAGEAGALDRARRIVDLFEGRFFHGPSGAVIEFLDAELNPAGGHQGRIAEPGHCYEWAVLLAEFERADGRDLVSWRRRLVGFADRFGRDPVSGFARNAVLFDGTVIDGARRLWPQLEMLRARLVQPECAEPGEAALLLHRLMTGYLSDGPEGGWMDAYDEAGTASAGAVPASMLYHFMTAFAPLVEADRVHEDLAQG